MDLYYKKKGSTNFKPLKLESDVDQRGSLFHELNSVELTVVAKFPPKIRKDYLAWICGYTRPSGIQRKRKRQIRTAKFMDHGSYEWSQYWRKSYGKFRRNATRYGKATSTKHGKLGHVGDK